MERQGGLVHHEAAVKVATWEPSFNALRTWLNTATAAIKTDLYTITLPSGAVYRYTAGDRNISVGGNNYILGPVFERSKYSLKVGIEVDTMTIDAWADDTITIGSVTFIVAAASGILDGAKVRVERLFSDISNVAKGAVLIFAGRVGEVFTERGHATFEILSETERLNVKIPSAVYQPGCRHTLFDLNCGVVRTARKISKTATVGTGATRQTFTGNFTATSASTVGYLTLGVVTFTSGANAGVSRTIKLHSGTTADGVIEVITPWPFPIAIGDAFDTWPGCDKSKDTCNTKFSNGAKFSAEPFIPLPDTVT